MTEISRENQQFLHEKHVSNNLCLFHSGLKLKIFDYENLSLQVMYIHHFRTAPLLLSVSVEKTSSKKVSVINFNYGKAFIGISEWVLGHIKTERSLLNNITKTTDILCPHEWGRKNSSKTDAGNT